MKPSEHKARAAGGEGEGFREFLVFYTAHESYMEFAVLEIAGWSYRHIEQASDAGGRRPLFGDNAATDDPDKATPLLAGSVKWDGCMDVDIGGSGESYRNHFCGLESALVLERAMRKVYELAEQRISRFDKELAS